MLFALCRAFLIATFAFSPIALAPFALSCLCSTVIGGKNSLITSPSLFGFTPIFASWIAFSISGRSVFSQGDIVIVVASVAITEPT